MTPVPRAASLERAVVNAKATVRKVDQLGADARERYRVALLKAADAGITTQRLSVLCETSWSRMHQELKRAGYESRVRTDEVQRVER